MGTDYAVDAVAEKARTDGALVREPVQEPYPVCYYCALKDPDGNFIEFSYGQTPDPGAETGCSTRMDSVDNRGTGASGGTGYD